MVEVGKQRGAHPRRTSSKMMRISNDRRPEFRPDRRFLRPRRRRKGRRSSPHPRERLRRSREGSPTSLPPSDVVAEDGSDKRGERRKKKRGRGRHGTSSLFALEPPVEASTEAGGEVDSVRKGPAVSSLSHRELEEVLSKSRKNRSRKKSGGGVPKGKRKRKYLKIDTIANTIASFPK